MTTHSTFISQPELERPPHADRTRRTRYVVLDEYGRLPDDPSRPTQSSSRPHLLIGAAVLLASAALYATLRPNRALGETALPAIQPPKAAASVAAEYSKTQAAWADSRAELAAPSAAASAPARALERRAAPPRAPSVARTPARVRATTPKSDNPYAEDAPSERAATARVSDNPY